MSYREVGASESFQKTVKLLLLRVESVGGTGVPHVCDAAGFGCDASLAGMT